jgi:hypothetical protein
MVAGLQPADVVDESGCSHFPLAVEEGGRREEDRERSEEEKVKVTIYLTHHEFSS